MKNENNPGIRLIDANALLRQDDLVTYDEDGFRIWYVTDINRVPTYELTEDDIRPVLESRCMTAVANEYLYALHGHPTAPRGTWADVGPFTFNGLTLLRFKCSICERQHFNKTNYCPNCGAQMSGGTLWQEQ